MEQVKITKQAFNFPAKYHAKLHLLNRVRNLKKGEPSVPKPIPIREEKGATLAKNHEQI